MAGGGAPHGETRELRRVSHVIGAGLAGLSLARELLNRGFNVRVVVKRGRVGGL
ncbi:MAG: NAD(P)-binding protein, partial [Acidilobaceae archaeon]